MGRLLLRCVELIPDGVRRWVRSRPALARPVAGLLRRAVPADEPVIMTIQNGPNRGLRLAIDRATPRYYWLQGHDEPDVIEALRRATKPGMVVADIGAHVGIETMMLSRWVGPAGRVLSVEADEATLGRLRTNCRINDLFNVTPIHVAVSDRNGTVRFSSESSVTDHVIDNANGNDATAAGGSGTTVRCSRLDDLIFTGGDDAHPRLDLVKIDVEGHEGAVLRGAPRVLSELRPTFAIEIHTPEALTECVGLLKDVGYAVAPIGSNAFYDRVIAAAPGEALPAPGAGEKFERSHLFATPVRHIA